ncbi:MAG: ComEC/Rec2 family competence protein [Rickettsiales bacterium]
MLIKNQLIKLKHLLYNEKQRFVLWIPVLFAVGIGIYFSLNSEPDIYRTFYGCAVLIVTILLFRRNPSLKLLAISLFIISLGILRAEIRTYEVAAPVLRKEIFFRKIEGKITDIINHRKGKKIILSELKIAGVSLENTPKYISVTLRKYSDNIDISDIVSLRGTLFPPPTPSMPDSYDFARMFFYKQLGAVGYSVEEPVIIQKSASSDFRQSLNALRLSITENIIRQMGSDSGNVAAALMVGEQSGISDNIKEIMRSSGIYHVLSISGLHMSLAAMLVFVTVRFLLSLYMPFALRFNIKKISAVVALISSFAYLTLAGYPTSAVRSFIMVASVMLAILCDRSGISLFSLAWAALIILILQPESLLSASFQLSFAATLAILAFYERFSYLLYRSEMSFSQRIKTYFLAAMFTSLVATLATMPFVIYNFNRFTIWSVAANMLLMPLVSFVIMPAAVLAFLFMPFSGEYYPLMVLDWGISLMIRGAAFFSSLPYSAINVASPTFYGLVTIIFAGLWLCLWQQKWRLLGIPFIVAGMMTVFLYKPYDMLINDEGKKIALRLKTGEFIFLRGRKNSFEAELWMKKHGSKDVISVKELSKDVGECNRYKCRLTIDGKKITIMRSRKNIEESCDDDPDIVISPNYLDRREGCKNVPLLIDKAYLRKNGATGLRFIQDNVEVKNSSTLRGKRIWVE